MNKTQQTKQKPVVELSGSCYAYFDNTSLIALTTFGELKNLFKSLETLSISSWHFLQKCPLTLGNLWCLHNSIFILFQGTLHSLWYKYSTLTNLCQNWIVKSYNLVLIYQHIIDTTLQNFVYAPLFYNTLLTESGVMMPQK